jgi:hypothetical protein
MEQTQEDGTRLRRARAPWVAVLLVSVAGTIIVIGFVPWVTMSFSGQIITPGTGCCSAEAPHTEPLPDGVEVSFHWGDTSGGRVNFFVFQPGPGDIKVRQCSWSNESSGACSFGSVGGTYSFYASNFIGTIGSQGVTYSGSYLSSLF